MKPDVCGRSPSLSMCQYIKFTFGGNILFQSLSSLVRGYKKGSSFLILERFKIWEHHSRLADSFQRLFNLGIVIHSNSKIKKQWIRYQSWIKFTIFMAWSLIHLEINIINTLEGLYWFYVDWFGCSVTSQKKTQSICKEVSLWSSTEPEIKFLRNSNQM